jgi:hypothetical protein
VLVRAATTGGAYHACVDRPETERRIDAILVRLDRGEDG